VFFAARPEHLNYHRHDNNKQHYGLQCIMVTVGNG